MGKIHSDAQTILRDAIHAVLPGRGVESALKEWDDLARVLVIAVGKAAWEMARVCGEMWRGRIRKGIVLTKYGHAPHELEGFEIIEAGHPVPDGNSIRGTQRILEMTQNLTKEDHILFLLSGGGSALFEFPEKGLTPEDISEVTKQLLTCGADIHEMNIIRKRLSAVKGGKFAALCAPAQIHAVVISDVLGDQADTIASGPVSPDPSTCDEALRIARKYDLDLRPSVLQALRRETPKVVENAELRICGSVRELCDAAVSAAWDLGYPSVLLTDRMDCEAREAGRFLAGTARRICQGEALESRQLIREAQDALCSGRAEAPTESGGEKGIMAQNAPGSGRAEAPTENREEKGIMAQNAPDSGHAAPPADRGEEKKGAVFSRRSPLCLCPPCAVIAGGETVVTLTGNGLGGRNQELVLAAAEGIRGLEDVVVASIGSDGTDGPTDAAAGHDAGDRCGVPSETNRLNREQLADNKIKTNRTTALTITG